MRRGIFFISLVGKNETINHCIKLCCNQGCSHRLYKVFAILSINFDKIIGILRMQSNQYINKENFSCSENALIRKFSLFFR